MSDRTFRLILDGKKGGLVKGSTPASAAKKVGFYTNSVKTGKSSIIFELQETTKDSKKKVYGPYKIKVKMAGGANPFSLLSTNSHNNTKNTKAINLLPPFQVINSKNSQNVENNLNNFNDLPSNVNLNYNFSGLKKSDLTEQLITLIRIKKRIHKLHNKFSRALSNTKRSVKNSLGELPKNSKLFGKTNLPSLKNIRLKPNKNYGSNINFANYNLQDSLARGDIEQKFYELSHFYKKINELIYKIQTKLSSNNHH